MTTNGKPFATSTDGNTKQTNQKIPRINAAQNPQIPKITWLRRGSKFTQMMESHIIKMAKTDSIYKVSNLLR
ncbi:MAG: hypothetical protein LBQ98_06920, partial [Nitrososphaerota archaeon]|nr:hypothetical protein [Nitrososphaerota archaeon]